MSYTIDIRAEYAAYGFQGNYFPVTLPTQSMAQGAKRTLPTRERTRPELGILNGNSILGLPLWMPTGFIIAGELSQLPNEPVVTINTENIIKITNLAGNESRGTVKESIAASDWMIKIEGLCIDPFKKGFPEDQVELVNYVRNQKEPIQMKNYFTELNGIDMVVIESFKWKRLAGTPYSVGYEMTLISDYEFELIIK